MATLVSCILAVRVDWRLWSRTNQDGDRSGGRSKAELEGENP